jgi:hypothetical protein
MVARCRRQWPALRHELGQAGWPTEDVQHLIKARGGRLVAGVQIAEHAALMSGRPAGFTVMAQTLRPHGQGRRSSGKFAEWSRLPDQAAIAGGLLVCVSSGTCTWTAR